MRQFRNIFSGEGEMLWSFIISTSVPGHPGPNVEGTPGVLIKWGTGASWQSLSCPGQGQAVSEQRQEDLNCPDSSEAASFFSFCASVSLFGADCNLLHLVTAEMK